MRTTPTLLIVEDDPILGMDLEEMAIRSGWRVVGPAMHLEEALKAATDEGIDYALLDFNLSNGTDSLPVAETLSARRIRYCFVTAADPAEIRASVPKAMVATKPISLFELQRILQKATPENV